MWCRSYFFSLPFLFGLVTTPLAQEGRVYSETVPWLVTGYNTLAANKEIAKHFIIVGQKICHPDNLDSVLCFELGWRNACLEVYASYSLSDHIPYILHGQNLSVLKVDNHKNIDLNPIVEIEKKSEMIIPHINSEEHTFWRVEVGSLETILNAEGGIFHQLYNGEQIKVFSPLQNGTIMKSYSTLFGIRPLLDEIIAEAEATKPQGEECAG